METTTETTNSAEGAGATSQEILDTSSETVEEGQEVSSLSSGTTSSEDSSTEEGAGEPQVDFTGVPKELRPQVEKFAKKYELDFKRAYTKKFQELGAKEKQRELEINQLRSQINEFATVAKTVLADPSKLDAYRKVYGPQFGIDENAGTPKEMPKLETVGDLLNYVTNYTSEQVKSIEQRAEQRAVAAIQEHQRVQRFETALNVLRKSDPKFTKFENVVVQMARENPKYRTMYTGNNEQDVLATALKDFKSMIAEEMETAKKETLASLKVKKGATTAVPKKTVATESTKTGLSKEEIIARVNARLSGS